MKNTYNFNVAVETPLKTPREEFLFDKWMPVLKRKAISDEEIKEYKKDLLSLKLSPMKAIAVLMLFTSFCYSQTYVYSVKLSKVLTTTAASNPTLYKQNIFDLKECKNNDDALLQGLKVGMFYCLPLKDGISLIAVVRPKQPETTGSIENQNAYTTNK